MQSYLLLYVAAFGLKVAHAAMFEGDWSNLTVYFSSEDSETCAATSENPGFTINAVPWDRYTPCFSLERLYTGDGYTTNTSRNARGIEIEALNSAAFSPGANYSRIHYHQTTSFAEHFTNDGEYEAGGLAARTLRVYPNEKCSRINGSEPESFIRAPALRWNCMSEEEGSCYPTHTKILSFSVDTADTYRDGSDYSTCADGEERWSSGANAIIASGFFTVVGCVVLSALMVL